MKLLNSSSYFDNKPIQLYPYNTYYYISYDVYYIFVCNILQLFPIIWWGRSLLRIIAGVQKKNKTQNLFKIYGPQPIKMLTIKRTLIDSTPSAVGNIMKW